MIGRDSSLSIAAACFPDALCKRLIRVSFPEVLSVSDDAPTHACIDSINLTHSVKRFFSKYDIRLRKPHILTGPESTSTYVLVQFANCSAVLVNVADLFQTYVNHACQLEQLTIAA